MSCEGEWAARTVEGRLVTVLIFLLCRFKPGRDFTIHRIVRIFFSGFKLQILKKNQSMEQMRI